MNDFLRQETEKLTRSWMQHNPGWLRDYLVAGVEDPRLNLQSILSRHFLIRALFQSDFGGLMDQEYRFAAVLAWLLEAAAEIPDSQSLDSLQVALERKTDNFEGLPIPHFVRHAFAALPLRLGAVLVPNYVETFLTSAVSPGGLTAASGADSVLNTFQHLWAQTLACESPSAGSIKLSVLEPACGSANDYRFLHQCGIAQFLNYSGFDLCAKNVENARALFPGIRFEPGNVFEIAAPDKSFDFAIVHDLFEHLSLEAMEIAVKEVCRVTRRGLCVGFFQMDEIPDHIVRPIEDYHWNLLSMEKMERLFAHHGFSAQVVHIGTFLRRIVGCEKTHNPNAYTFLLHGSCRESKKQS